MKGNGGAGLSTANPWLLKPGDRRRPGLPNLVSLFILTVVGTVVGTLGLVSLPVGFGFSSFWPAMTLQVAGGIWFGGWGVLAGGLIGLLSNVFNHGGTLYALGYLPSNLAQAFIPAWIFRHWRINPSLPGRREIGLFILSGVLLANFVGATLAACAQGLAGGIRISQLSSLYSGWFLGNGIPCLVFGIPLMIAFSPQIVNSPFFCKRWWGGSSPSSINWRRFRDWPVASRLLVEFALAGVLPMLIIGIAEDAILSGERSETASLLTSAMLNASVFLCLIISGFVAKKLKARVNVLSEGAKRLGEGELDYRIQDIGKNELGLLGSSFNEMAVKLVASREELAKTVAERERSLREMEIAADIQRSFLPASLPDIPSVEFAAHMEPARLVGGDFYDFIPLADGRWGLLIADVMGKGAPAALFMALARSLVRVYAEGFSTPSEVIDAVNRYICRDNPTGIFVTLFLGYLDSNAETLSYANAGHNPPLLLHSDKEGILALAATGTPVGLIDKMKYENRDVRVGLGDILLLYTDGVTEAENPEGGMFGRERLDLLLNTLKNSEASEVLDRIKEVVKKFAAGAPQSDDITVVVAKWCDTGKERDNT